MSAGDKIRAHQCNYPQCGRVFLKANNLKQHERTHTGKFSITKKFIPIK